MAQVSKPVKDGPMFVASANALAGAAGGIIAMTIVFPLDIIRTKLQAQATHDTNQKEETKETDDQKYSDNSVKIPQPSQRLGISDVVREIYQRDGISGFYQALSSQLTCIFVSDMVYFFAVTLVKQSLYGKREVDVMSNLKASSLAGFVNVFCTAPFWRAQVLLMLQSKQKETNVHEENASGLLDAWKKIIAKDGFNGLYKGVGPSLWLVSNPIIQFVVYEELINALKRVKGNDGISALMYFICGAIGKTAATFATYPLQVMQTQLRRKNSPFVDMEDCITRFAIPKLVGGDISALYSGLMAKLYQTVSNSAIKFMIYEKVLVLILVVMRWIRKVIVAAVFARFVSKTNQVGTGAASV